MTFSKKVKPFTTGETVRNWTVLQYVGEKGSGRNSYWLCRCSCGNKKEVCGTLLRNGKSSKCQRCSGKDNGRLALNKMAKKHLYIIQCGDYFKIGSSDNPERRIKDLRSSNPYPLEVVAILYNRGTEEADWHNKYKAQHHHGEWFVGVCEVL